jgi:PBP1b-binding outer membrane lipoprotein LpoB
MKRVALFVAIIFLLSGCSQSNQESAKELVKQSCELEPTEQQEIGEPNPGVEPLIRQAVDLDEKYRPYLIAYLKWQDALRTWKNTEDPAISAKADDDISENFAIVDSYCNY